MRLANFFRRSSSKLSQFSNPSTSYTLKKMLHLKLEFKVKGGSKKMFTIGKVARRIGIRPSAIRYYERQGMLQPTLRGANGYRTYGDDAVRLLLFVKRAQSLGITLREIKPLLNLASQGQQPCSHVKQLARNHLREIDGKIRELQALRNELRTLLRRRGRRPHALEVCPLIEGAQIGSAHVGVEIKGSSIEARTP
jgi:DNA-binding transcriptional MerR regulator